MSSSINEAPQSYDPIYVDLASESEDPTVTQIDSLCLQCEETGITRLLMTRIPHYKEIILTSFECGNCGNKNTGVQSATTQEQGVSFLLRVKNPNDINRQVVTSAFASIHIPHLDFEIPYNKEKGDVTTVEGIIKRVILNLEESQPVRKQIQPEIAEKISEFIEKLSHLLTVDEPFDIKIEDPSGNSFIENPKAPLVDEDLIQSNYERTPAQNILLGISNEFFNEENSSPIIEEENLKDEIMTFSTLCAKCSIPVQTNMKVTPIPHFKEVIIMASHCDGCGFRTNEVKSGSAISAKGRKITLTISDITFDMSRDVLKSNTCNIEIPELEIYVGGGILGGKFTTVEGLLKDISNDLANNPFLMGDSSNENTKGKIQDIVEKFDKVLEGEIKATLILDDPAGNSYVQNIYAPDDDPELTIEDYERSFEQNEDLGLNDMKTENYA